MKEWDFLERIANELLQTLYQRMWFRSWDVYNEGWAVERIENALKKAIEENRRRMYVYIDFRDFYIRPEDITVAIADSKEEALKKFMEKSEGIWDDVECVLTLNEFIERFLVGKAKK